MILTRLASSLAAIALLLLPSFALGQQPKAEETKDTVTELAKKGYAQFVNAVSKTDLLDKVASGDVTVIAPNDKAFSGLSKAQLDALLADKEKLTAFLGHHIIEGKHTISSMKKAEVKTLSGSSVQVIVKDGQFTIGTARIVRSDLATTNGMVHGTDQFLQMP